MRSPERLFVLITAFTLLGVLAHEPAASAQSCGSTYGKVRWVRNSTPGNCQPCQERIDIWADFFQCSDDSWTGVSGVIADGGCSCSPFPVTWQYPDGSNYGDSDCVETPECHVEGPQPEMCTGVDYDDAAPFNEGCGDDEQSCSALSNDADGAPVRFGSGRVESNPFTFVEAPTPDGIFFGYRLQLSSHRAMRMAHARVFNGTQEPFPTVHQHTQTTYFVGHGWMDDFGDRLLVTSGYKAATTITWQSRWGIVTFTQSNGWKSYGGKYELIDCNATPQECGSTLYGRWVVRTTDTRSARRIWTFEEHTYVPYNGGAPFTLGRLKRHALLGQNATNLTGYYGYTVNWHSQGYITTVLDSMGRSLSFAYDERLNGSIVGYRRLREVTYQPNATASAVVVALNATADANSIDRVNVSAAGTQAPYYMRFRYDAVACVGRDCGLRLTDVIVPGQNNASSPGVGASPLSTEVVLEHNAYAFADGGFRATSSEYPGREYAYEYGTQTGQYVTKQLDLHQPTGSCSQSSCSAGSECRVADATCYVATIHVHDQGRLPLSRSPAGAGGGISSSRTYAAPSVANQSGGLPRTSIDAGGVKTTFGFDTTGRLRCRVGNDTDDEAFADPQNPNTSDCAGPTNSQVVKVDYNGPCSDGHTVCVLKTTPSLLGGTVVEEEDLDAATLLPVRRKVTGKTRDIDGNLVTRTQTSTTTYDSFGRVVETNGPLTDSIALDKKTIAYWPATGGNNAGHVQSVTVYVGTSASNTPLTTQYADYDAFGVPHKITQPNGDWVEYVATTADRLNWTINQRNPANEILSTASVVLNPNGNVLKTVDPDGVCTTFEYTDATGYIGAPTRIRRSANDTSCGAPINIYSGEVEVREYIAGEADRLASITRMTNGSVEYLYNGFAYDRERRVASASTTHSTSPYTFSFTDVLPTGVTAPEGPGPGTWKTQQTVDEFARPTGLLRYLDASNKLTHAFSYSSAFAPRPTQLTRGYNGAATSVSMFAYDDFGGLISATVPEAGAPAAPSSTRYEYDVAGRLLKKRIGIGTPLVRTDAHAYDSLGRVLSVDHDLEHPVNCATAPAGTPIQDQEYKYDSCPSPDVPLGFTCSNALGRLTIARAILQCGSGVIVKRGRWYAYTNVGQVAQVAYATVTGATIGTPAITGYTYSSAGRVLQYTSPINSIYGTKYTYSGGAVTQLDTTQSPAVKVADAITHYAFGPLATMTANVTQAAGGTSTRALKYEATYYNEGQLNQFKWRLVHSGGTAVAPISLVYQNFGLTPAGLVKDRYDFGSYEQSRYYGYDALLRLTCEARGQTSTSTIPTASHCVQSSPLAAGLHTYGNGQSATSPPDVRLTSFIRGEGAAGTSYTSPSTETSTYSAGSSQVQQVSRSSSTLTIGYDAIGRRSFEYDSFDVVRSRRDYTYLPNGQLASISGRTSANVAYTVAIRYDEDGRPLTISETQGGTALDTFELFWDDADRLIATNIMFGTARTCGTRQTKTAVNGVNCTSIRWHYHYLGSTLVAATREMIPTGSYAPAEPLKRFWAVADERGLVHRLVDQSGNTSWQARWDASGWRHRVGTPNPEMWVPFGLPGQIVLGEYIVYTGFSAIQEFPGWTITYTTGERWGTGAYASGSGGTWTRPPIALNQWRAYDPLMGGFLQPDPSDVIGRTEPEAYALARNNPVLFFDRSGLASSLDFDSSCTILDQLALLAAANYAYMALSKCRSGYCAQPQGRRKWLNELFEGTVSCPKTTTRDGLSIDSEGFPEDLSAALTYGRWSSLKGLVHPDTEYYPATISDFYAGRIECLAKEIAHERLHPLISGGFLATDIETFGKHGPGGLVRIFILSDKEEENFIDDAVSKCFDCGTVSGKGGFGQDGPHPIVFEK